MSKQMEKSMITKKQLSIREVSEIYGIPEWTLRAYIHKRLIPHRRVRSRIYIPTEKFEKWLEAGDVEVKENISEVKDGTA